VSTPTGTTCHCDGLPTPIASKSSRTSDATATSASVREAKARSACRNTSFFNAEKYSCSTCPWNVCTTTGTSDRNAAARPSAPAFARWVCTIAGRHRRITARSWA
jgi:hypothetical protein